MQKIVDLIMKIYKMTIIDSLLKDKYGKTRFFEETFLFININTIIVLKMFFFIFNNINIDFKKVEIFT